MEKIDHSRYYTVQELELLRLQLIEGNRLAQIAARNNSAKMHPRIVELKTNIEYEDKVIAEQHTIKILT